MSLLRSDLKNIHTYEFDEQREGKICLDLNENCLVKFDLYPIVRQFMESDFYGYRSPKKLEREIARYLQVKETNVLLTAGADDALRIAFTAALQPADRVLIFQPAYSYYQILLKIQKAKIVFGKYRSDLRLSLSELNAFLRSGLKMVVLTNPHNPCGTFLKSKELLPFISRFSQTIFLLDETYADFAEECSLLEQVENYPNLLIIRSFSKSFALAGLRLGALIANEENLTELRKIAMPFAVSNLSQKVLFTLLNDRSYLEVIRQKNSRLRSLLIKKLKKAGFYVEKSVANFVLLYLGKGVKRVRSVLQRNGILVKDLSGQSQLEGFVRVTVGKRSEQEALLQALQASRIKTALIFDLDGVILDSNSIYIRALGELFFEITRRQLSQKELLTVKRRIDCCSDYSTLELLLKRAGIILKKTEIKNLLDSKISPRKGESLLSAETLLLSRDSLRFLAKRYLLAVVTSRPRAEAEYSLKKWLLQELFSVLITADEPEVVSKPDPAGILLALQRLGAEAAIYVGDHPADLVAARRAGIVAFAVRSPFLSPARAIRLGAKKFLEVPEQIMEVL